MAIFGMNGQPVKIVRWGPKGIAIRTSNGEIVILGRGPGL